MHYHAAQAEDAIEEHCAHDSCLNLQHAMLYEVILQSVSYL